MRTRLFLAGARVVVTVVAVVVVFLIFIKSIYTKKLYKNEEKKVNYDLIYCLFCVTLNDKFIIFLNLFAEFGAKIQIFV